MMYTINYNGTTDTTTGEHSTNWDMSLDEYSTTPTGNPYDEDIDRLKRLIKYCITQQIKYINYIISLLSIIHSASTRKEHKKHYFHRKIRSEWAGKNFHK